jgi:hypothetical protein
MSDDEQADALSGQYDFIESEKDDVSRSKLSGREQLSFYLLKAPKNDSERRIVGRTRAPLPMAIYAGVFGTLNKSIFGQASHKDFLKLCTIVQKDLEEYEIGRDGMRVQEYIQSLTGSAESNQDEVVISRRSATQKALG